MAHTWRMQMEDAQQAIKEMYESPHTKVSTAHALCLPERR